MLKAIGLEGSSASPSRAAAEGDGAVLPAQHRGARAHPRSQQCSARPASGCCSAAGRGTSSQSLREPFAVLQAALLGVVGLILAFGLALAVGRYESRRAAVVEDANAIGTTYLRAQLLAEPVRTRSLERLVRYTDTSIRLSNSVPGSPAARLAVADGQRLQRELWGLAGQAVAGCSGASAPRLYVETLNEMIDMQTVRVSGLNNRVPPAVLWLEMAGAMVALGLLAFYLAILGRGLYHGPVRGRPRRPAALGDLRSRPADARPDPRPLDAADGATRLDDPATGGSGRPAAPNHTVWMMSRRGASERCLDHRVGDNDSTGDRTRRSSALSRHALRRAFPPAAAHQGRRLARRDGARRRPLAPARHRRHRVAVGPLGSDQGGPRPATSSPGSSSRPPRRSWPGSPTTASCARPIPARSSSGRS